MKQLEVMLSLVDKFSRPLKMAGGELNNFAGKSRAAFGQMVAGGATLWGVAQSIMGILGPADEMQRALAEVKSIGVADTALKNLGNTAIMFSMKYGESAAGFVASAASIAGAIDGLSDKELRTFTTAGSILAKGTRADANTITNYIGTMYGVFQKTADAMGRSSWVEVMTGQTAEAVKIFKSDGKQMSDAFTSIGANATAAGIGMSEQFAILGQLQATMSGSEAGTKYKAFLQGVGNAQKTLGLTFVNQDGSMKGIVDIMSLIQKKYGDIKKVADSDMIKKAFGSDEAVSLIKLLAQNVDGLKNNIDQIGKINGMDNARKMAADMTNQFDRLLQVWNGMRIAVGGALMPVINPLIQRMSDMGTQATAWLLKFKNIARWIGYISIALTSLVAVFALANIAVAAGKFLWMGFLIVLKLLRPVLLMLRLAFFLTGLAANFMGLPITLVIGLIALLVAGVWAFVAYWDEMKAAIMDTAAFQWLMGIVTVVGALFRTTWAMVKDGWQNVVNFFMGLSPVQAFTDFKNTITDVFKGLWDYLKNSFAQTYNWIVDKLNMIPGVDIEMKNVAPEVTPGGSQPGSAPLLTGSNLQSTGRGGIMGQVSQSTNNNSNAKTQNISTVNFNVAQPLTPQALQENMELYGHG
ncbi:phage tail tape measure protein [Serratia ficaria]|uniref:phage tail tape measure protein n=1 Tax=Serratia ficaria TaxID=61651 RepID=UPI00217A2126|nr:phage tail tape measure protein [Serratia ficaria]CAI0760259.1 phage tail tape measure protein, TP901 family, core region [Serratia ficaria]CAI1569062.1 phage tail tape measure protein, TP901 family, core region [Serratia ficaria]CAI2405113.1 phage tail tape measure protein, TP901 family, core region [Serratia ficaria]CAI2431328.1 phage tail tape measure protein, TP901 family, core region [Serratia ficaria]CAI2499087.1 phage tail tape measure protein, TP901 family, core region [Serratia fic